ncbi:MAG: LON peptidase substrate-binding domain-containing protein, partial [Selenomonadales bacterium]|nr:LON peptidase substrate-binding domain-containing protein [Selenomonadales bacterium]
MANIRTIPMLPLRGLLVFPYMMLHLDVGRVKSIEAVEAVMLQDRQIMLASQKDSKIDDPIPEDICEIGTVAEIKQVLKLPGGMMRVLVEGLYRAKIVSYEESEPHYVVQAEEYDDEEEASPEVEALMRAAVHQFEEWAKASQKIPPETVMSVIETDGAGRLADLIASHLVLKLEDKQYLLDAIDVKTRYERLCEMLARELEIIALERKISTRVRKQMEKTQKEYYLREQLKAIQKELGDRDERLAEAAEYREKLASGNFPQNVRAKAEKEIKRLEKMQPMSAESAVVRTYLDWLVEVPWTKETEDILDIDHAEGVLEDEHYGLKKVKERIIEYLSVRKLTQSMKGPILCLVGPPGVGKTSLAHSVANAMNRKFVRVSLGGVRDEAEIRGHRRTYIGAMPGRIMYGMKNA